ncbi:COMM domain-containing protein 10 isoform X1 [Anolis sagrei]|uniref:COMM domain-containing protein 10 isoform X1 n=1 Tax=Anolis sagrei TaxID=38937 RepID=UPI003521F10F
MAAPIILPDTGSIRKAVSLINAIDTGKFSRLLSRILQKLHLKTESTFTEEEEEKLQAAFLVEKQDLHLVLETITFILEQAVYHNSKPAILKQQLEHSNLDFDKVEVLATAWAAAGPEVVEKFRQRILSPHKLDSVGWQLNLQMAQSTQAKQKSPKAVLELGITNEDSKNMEKVFVEFSHEELFEFYNKTEHRLPNSTPYSRTVNGMLVDRKRDLKMGLKPTSKTVA